MLKVYKAESDVSLNIMINGEKVHISFSPMTKKGSVYYTSDEEEQKALEDNYYYNKLYYLDSVEDQSKIQEKPKTKPRNTKKETEITVSCLEDAKEYLADRFGISRTSMKGMDDILKYAKDYKIHFVGPEFE